MTAPRFAVITVLLLLSVAVGGACTDDAELGSSEEAISFTFQTYFDCATQSCAHVPIISASDDTCFLAGVTGHIDGINGVTPSVNVSINASNYWEMTASPPVQHVLVTCIAATQNRILGHTGPSTPTVWLGPATLHRRCFLSGEWFYLYSGAADYHDIVRVYQSRGNWYVNTSMVSPGGASEAMAVCVDVPSFVGTFAYGHDTSGTVAGPLVTYQNNNACGLSSLNGNFGYYDQGSPYPGVQIVMLPDWAWVFYEHVGAEATCVSGTP